MSGKVTRTIEARLWEKTDVRGPDECWPWLGARGGNGKYGLFYRHGHLMGAHVAAYELVNGPVPEGLQVDHQCNNSWCVNPAHLKAMTQLENIRRGSSLAAENYRKTDCKNGHEFTEANTRVDTRGARICRTCDNAKDRARHAARKGTI